MENEFRVFPNPNDGFFTIPAKSESGLLEIFDGMGRKVYEQETVGGEELKINFQLIESGVYWVRWKLKSYIHKSKIIKL